MKLHFNSKERAEKTQEFISGNEVVQRFSFIHQDHESTEEMNHDGVHDRISINGFQNSDFSRTQNSKKLRYQSLRLIVIEDIRIVFLVEDELEGGIINKLLDFLHESLRVGVVDLKTKF